MFTLASLSVFLLTLPAAFDTSTAQSIVLKAGAGPAVVLSGAGSAGSLSEEEEQEVKLGDLEEIPKVWIGVRVCTVPEALAAHIKRGTLMLVNIAENSPAERAGLDRYDIVLSFNDRAIESMEDLLEAIRENGADQAAKMVVIQGGEEKTLTVTPVQRDLAVVPTFKYEEQEVAEVDPLSKYFGHRLKLDSDGNLVLTPQGRLDRLPEDIKRLLDEIPDLEWDFLDDLPTIELDEDFPTFEFFIDGDEVGESSRITITITEDGKTLTIHRTEDGKFTVERQDPDGKHPSQSYDDVDGFRAGDPEAYRIYRKSAPHRGLSTIILPPDLKDLGTQQREFQLELKTQLDKARQQIDEALEKSCETRRNIEIRRHKATPDDEDTTATHTKTVMLAIDNGHITLTITEDGVTREYKFDSREAFQKSEPELYEHYQSYLDE
jgi:hypothetical protein